MFVGIVVLYYLLTSLRPPKAMLMVLIIGDHQWQTYRGQNTPIAIASSLCVALKLEIRRSDAEKESCSAKSNFQQACYQLATLHLANSDNVKECDPDTAGAARRMSQGAPIPTNTTAFFCVGPAMELHAGQLSHVTLTPTLDTCYCHECTLLCDILQT